MKFGGLAVTAQLLHAKMFAACVNVGQDISTIKATASETVDTETVSIMKNTQIALIAKIAASTIRAQRVTKTVATKVVFVEKV